MHRDYRDYVFLIPTNSISLVNGDANFTMESTNLVVAGFSQPGVSRTLIDFAGNTEKGFSQRFLWIFPKPTYAYFSSLEPIDEVFTEKVGTCKSQRYGEGGELY